MTKAATKAKAAPKTGEPKKVAKRVSPPKKTTPSKPTKKQIDALSLQIQRITDDLRVKTLKLSLMVSDITR